MRNLRIYDAMGKADTLVIAPYPVAGNHENTGERYGAIADITYFDVLGFERAGSNMLTPNPKLRQDLSPSNFDQFIEKEAEDLQQIVRRYDRVVGFGESTGSFPTLSMLNSQLLRITHGCIVDGINLRLNRGPLQSRLDWRNYYHDERQNIPDQDVDCSELPSDNKDLATTVKGALGFINEQYHLAPLWRSEYSRSTAINIAANRPELPMLAVFMGHSAISTHDEVDLFGDEFVKARLGSPRIADSAAVRVEYEADGWHSDLLTPEYTAEKINSASRMNSYV